MNQKRKAILMATALFCLNVGIYAQSISLNMNKVSVKQAMNELKSKSGYSFVYSAGDVNTNKQVTVKAKQLDEAVRQILEGQKLTYEIQGKNIIVKKQTEGVRKDGKQRRVTGVVTDAQGEPIIGANVTLQGDHTQGVITDLDGAFMLEVPENTHLEISYIGYASQIVSVKGKNHVFVQLKEDTRLLDEVVVVGYMTQRKGLTTGAVASMKVDEAAKTLPTTSAGNILVGKLAGVNVGTANAVPGTAPDISIRTGASWNSESVT